MVIDLERNGSSIIIFHIQRAVLVKNFYADRSWLSLNVMINPLIRKLFLVMIMRDYLSDLMGDKVSRGGTKALLDHAKHLSDDQSVRIVIN